MDKTARKGTYERGFLSNMREALNPNRLTEKLFNPQFQKVMNNLRAKDDAIRSIAAGEAIGTGAPGMHPVAIKSLVKSMKSNINRREYMSAVVDLSRFHSKLLEILQQINELDLNVNEVHNEFLFKDLDDEKKKHLLDLKQRFAAEQAILVKKAGVGDFLHNFFTDRGRALGAWEKRYPKQTKQLRADSEKIQKTAESLALFIISTLKDMAKARHSRNVDSYLSSALSIKDKVVAFESTFKDFYIKNVKGFLEKINLLPPEVKQEVESTDTQKSPGEQVAVPTTDNVGPLPGAFDTSHMQRESPSSEREQLETAPTLLSPQMLRNPHIPPPPLSPPAMPTSPFVSVTPTERTNSVTPTQRSVSVAPATERSVSVTPTERGIDTIAGPPSPQRDTLIGVAPPGAGTPVPPTSNVQSLPPMPKSDQLAREFGWATHAHHKFYASLEALGSESPVILKAYISRYAKKIASTDPETSIQLLNVARSIEV